MTEPKKRLPNGMGIAFGMGLGFILGWLLNEVVWGLAIGIFIGTWVGLFRATEVMRYGATQTTAQTVPQLSVRRRAGGVHWRGAYFGCLL